MDKNRFFRAIPKVDTLIEQCDSAGLFDRYGREITVDCIRERTEALREFIGKSEDETEIIRRTESLLSDIAAAAEKLARDIGDSGESGNVSYYVSDDPGLFCSSASIFLGTDITGRVTRIDIEKV